MADQSTDDELNSSNSSLNGKISASMKKSSNLKSSKSKSIEKEKSVSKFDCINKEKNDIFKNKRKNKENRGILKVSSFFNNDDIFITSKSDPINSLPKCSTSEELVNHLKQTHHQGIGMYLLPRRRAATQRKPLNNTNIGYITQEYDPRNDISSHRIIYESYLQPYESINICNSNLLLNMANIMDKNYQNYQNNQNNQNENNTILTDNKDDMNNQNDNNDIQMNLLQN